MFWLGAGETPEEQIAERGASARRSVSVRADDLSGLDVDKDVLLALVLGLDLDHVDILAFLPLNRHVGGLAGDSRKRDLRCLRARDLRHGRRILQRLVAQLPDA